MKRITLAACLAFSFPLLSPGGSQQINRADGDVDIVETADGSPFSTWQRKLRNTGNTDREVKAIEFTSEIPLNGPVKEYRTLGVDGLKGAESAASSHLFLAVAKPDATEGTVAGWITQERGSGSVHSQATDQGLTITGRLEFGVLRIKPGQSIITDAFVIGSFIDAREGLETFADAIAKANRHQAAEDPQWLLHLVFKPAWRRFR